MTKNEVLRIVAEALGEEGLTEESSQENTEAWDSLGHLSILTAIDDSLQGRAAAISGLASASSVSSIVKLLSENQLLDD